MHGRRLPQSGRSIARVTLMLIGMALAPSTASAATIFFGPTPYLSAADIPAGFYVGGPTALEDFEDGVINFGIIATGGILSTPGSLTDSVDGDDGAIDGSGNGGHSWLTDTPVTFSLPGLPTAVGLVWTDGLAPVIFEAFFSGGGNAIIGPVTIHDGVVTGTTAEDRFFGLQDDRGVVAIRIALGAGVVELDHLQFGIAPTQNGPGPGPGPNPVPEPASLVLMGAGLLGLATRLRR